MATSLKILKWRAIKSIVSNQTRLLNLQEYSSKRLLQENGLNVQRFIVADLKTELSKAVEQFNVNEYVVKAQILAGGRGKGHFSNGFKGGVKVTKSAKEAAYFAQQMIGNRLITHQTDKDGVFVNKVMIAESANLLRETYVAILMDREAQCPVIVVSPAGGVDIEDVAEKSPHLIFKEKINIDKGLTRSQAEALAEQLEFKGAYKNHAIEQLLQLYKMFVALDAVQIEINPFCETDNGKVLCVDAKLNFDDSAAYRQRSVFSMGDQSDMDDREIQAQRNQLNYVALSGNIGCLVNGAGLAMATMDLIQLHGGRPANFLDVGGSVQEEQVHQAFGIISSDHRVKAILVNIFGGIVNCEVIARGLISAFKKLNLKMPVVVRLEGTNVESARKIIADSKLPIVTASDLEDAAKKAVGCL